MFKWPVGLYELYRILSYCVSLLLLVNKKVLLQILIYCEYNIFQKKKRIFSV